MRVLLDTHLILWSIVGSEKLPSVVLALLRGEKELFVSIASVWEVAVKYRSHPQGISMSEIEYVDYCRKLDFSFLPIEVEHIFALRTLERPESAPKHHDPFDRIMIAQAKASGMMFLTHDALLRDYGERCVFYV